MHYEDKMYITNLWDSVLRRIVKEGDLKLCLVTVFKDKMISYTKPIMGPITTSLTGIAQQPIQRTGERLRVDH